MIAAALTRPSSRPVAGVILAVLSLIVVALSVGSVALDSATADEPAHIAAGYLKLVHGELNFFREQPPLMNSISAIPLVLAGYKFTATVAPDEDHWTVGRRFLYRSGYDAHRILFLARLPTIALLLALCWTVYFVVAHYSGSRGWGIAAFVLTGFCPNLMAHGRLATVDLAVTLFCFLGAALFLRLIEKPAIPLAIAFGVACASAVLSKTSGAILGPWCAVALALAFLMGRVPMPRRLFVCIAVAFLAAAAFFESLTLLLASHDYVARRVPSHSMAAMLALPFHEWKDNMAIIGTWYGGRFKLQYFMGHFSSRGWRQYYPAAFLLKTTIPALILLGCAAAFAIWRQKALLRSLSFRAAKTARNPLPMGNERGSAGDPSPSARLRMTNIRGSFESLALTCFTALFFGAAIVGKLALGLRYVLPVYPFFYAAAVILLAGTIHRRAAFLAVSALLIWHVAENLVTYPSYISYFNESIGSHRNADRYLIDSNLDWGQDLRRLDLWCYENNVDTIALHYFGGGEPGVDMTTTHVMVEGPGRPPLRQCYFALSRHLYRTSQSRLMSAVSYETYLAGLHAHYVSTIGGSIDVYRID